MELRKPSIPGAEFDARGMESIAYDIEKYLQRMGPDVALKTFADFATGNPEGRCVRPRGRVELDAQRAGVRRSDKETVEPAGHVVLHRSCARPYLDTFNTVFEKQKLDAIVYPQMRGPLAPLHGDDYIHETVVSEINIAGLPAVTVPAGYYASGAPFNLVIVAPQWSEADILAIAYAYEQAAAQKRPHLTKE